MIFGHKPTNEFMWLIELNVMFMRYCRRMNIDPEANRNLVDAEWLRRHWVKACMRLGDDVVLRIVRSQKEKIIGKDEATGHD